MFFSKTSYFTVVNRSGDNYYIFDIGDRMILFGVSLS